MLNQQEAHRLWRYDQGRLYWKVKPSGNVRLGAEAGCVHGNGYREVSINRNTYGIHRVVFLMFHGFMPPKIDHIDNNPLNNRVENLRAATHSSNGWNRRMGSNNSSGVKNVHRDNGRWVVTLHRNNKRHYYGRYYDIAEAAKVAEQARLNLYGNYARHK
jgi:hypothetical protein